MKYSYIMATALMVGTSVAWPGPWGDNSDVEKRDSAQSNDVFIDTHIEFEDDDENLVDEDLQRRDTYGSPGGDQDSTAKKDDKKVDDKKDDKKDKKKDDPNNGGTYTGDADKTNKDDKKDGKHGDKTDTPGDKKGDKKDKKASDKKADDKKADDKKADYKKDGKKDDKKDDDKKADDKKADDKKADDKKTDDKKTDDKKTEVQKPGNKKGPLVPLAEMASVQRGDQEAIVIHIEIPGPLQTAGATDKPNKPVVKPLGKDTTQEPDTY